jgi:hypothetical protein
MQLSRAFDCRLIHVKAALDNRFEALKIGDRHIAADENSETEILE